MADHDPETLDHDGAKSVITMPKRVITMGRNAHLTNGFSKKLTNHAAALALWVAHYNFCRVHESLRVTQAMALGITDHIWTIAELIENALAAPQATPSSTPVAPTKPTTPRLKMVPATERPQGTQLRVIWGGRR